MSYPNSRAATSAPAPRGARVRDRLPRLHMAAMQATKSATPAFWEDVRHGRAAAPGKIWLAAKVAPTDPASLDPVHAALAWAAGYT
ncbi:hypothetical protein ACPXCX_55940, partial [Streptomyces sp. DT225]